MIIWSNLTFIANCEKTNNFLQNCSLAENKLKIDRANFDLSIETTEMSFDQEHTKLTDIEVKDIGNDT